MNLSPMPCITIIMPCYNGMMYLERSLDAFFSQSYGNKKIVVVDGKSTDKSHEIISDYIARGYPIIWDKTLDTGISNAINIGIRHLDDGDVFGYLGSDDILMPNILSEISYLFCVADGVDGIYFDSFSYVGGDGKLNYRRCPTDEFSLANLLKYGTIVGLQNIYIKSSLIDAGCFSEANKYSMDYDLYVRLTKNKGVNFSYIPKASTVNIMNGNLSTKFAFEGALEAINSAVKQVGYTPRLMCRLVLLRLAKLRYALLNI